MMVLLCKNKKRIQELEAESEREKQSESKMVESFAVQTKQLGEVKVELEELKININSLRNRVESLEELSRKNSRESNAPVVKTTAQACEKKATLKAKSLLDEVEMLKNELRLAIGADEKSTKILDDIALALQELATEANQAKEKTDDKEKNGMLRSPDSEDQGPLIFFMTEPEDSDKKVLDEYPDKAEARKGSVSDANAETPISEPHDEGTSNSVNFDHSDCAHDDSDTERNSNKRMKTMFQGMGDFLTVRGSFHRKELSNEKTIVTHP
ncbi:hypothetical protein Pfo_007850 [Paulownia fortunei]|nr:hypothetical protein Pfo_007850 [Paulownia fortunei]